MKFSKKYLAIIGGAVLIILLTSVAPRASEKAAHCWAAEKSMPTLTHAPGVERSKKMLETIREVRTVEALKLDEEQIAQFLSKMRKIREEGEKHRVVRKEKVEELAKLLESKASPLVLEKSLAEMKTDEEKFHAENKALRDEIDSILTIGQRAKLIIFERSFHEEMCEMLRRPSRRERPSEESKGTKGQRGRFPWKSEHEK